MADINVLTMTGRLTKDATTKSVGVNGTMLTEFDIACNTGFGDYARTTYITVCLWGKSGQKALQYLKKGTAIGVTGEFQIDKWQGSDGQPHSKNKLSTNNFVFINGSSKSKDNGEQQVEFEVSDADTEVF